MSTGFTKHVVDDAEAIALVKECAEQFKARVNQVTLAEQKKSVSLFGLFGLLKPATAVEKKIVPNKVRRPL